VEGRLDERGKTRQIRAYSGREERGKTYNDEEKEETERVSTSVEDGNDEEESSGGRSEAVVVDVPAK